MVSTNIVSPCVLADTSQLVDKSDQYWSFPKNGLLCPLVAMDNSPLDDFPKLHFWGISELPVASVASVSLPDDNLKNQQRVLVPLLP